MTVRDRGAYGLIATGNATSGSTTVNVGYPPHVAGDLLVVWVMASNNQDNPNNSVVNGPAGWTRVAHLTPTFISGAFTVPKGAGAVFVKVAESNSEPIFTASCNHASAWRATSAAFYDDARPGTPGYLSSDMVQQLVSSSTQGTYPAAPTSSEGLVYRYAWAGSGNWNNGVPADTAGAAPAYTQLINGSSADRATSSLFWRVHRSTDGPVPSARGNSTAGVEFVHGMHTFMVLPPPAPPTQPGAFTQPTSGTSYNQTVPAAWGASSDPDGDTITYRLERTHDNGATWTAAGTTTATSVTLDSTAWQSSTTSRLRVRAESGSPVLVSAWRESATFTIQHNQAPTVPDQLAPAGNPTLDRTQALDLSWRFRDPDAGDTQSRYRLEYRLTSAASFTVVDSSTVGGGTLSRYTFAAGSLAAGAYEWRVQTFDSQGVASPVSPSAFFTLATPGPAPTITAPANGATVPAQSEVVWSTPGQTHYRVQVVEDNAGAPDLSKPAVFDSGEVQSATARNLALTFPTNNVTRHVRVQTRDTNGLLTTWSTVRVLVSYTPPPVPVVQAEPQDGAGHTRVVVSNPTPATGEPAVTGNDVFRFDPTAGVETRVARVGPNGTYLDYSAASGVAYRYRVAALASNGTSRDSATVTPAPLRLSGVWLHDPADPASTALALPFDGMGRTSEDTLDLTLRQYVGRDLPTPEWGTSEARSVKLGTTFRRDDAGLRDRLMLLVRRRAVLLYRDTRGRKLYAVLGGVPLTDGPLGQTTDLTFTAVSYVEGV